MVCPSISSRHICEYAELLRLDHRPEEGGILFSISSGLLFFVIHEILAPKKAAAIFFQRESILIRMVWITIMFWRRGFRESGNIFGVKDHRAINKTFFSMNKEKEFDGFVEFLKRRCLLKDGTWDIKRKINEKLITETAEEDPIPPEIQNWYLLDYWITEWIEANCSEQIFVFDTNDNDMYLGVSSDVQLDLLFREAADIWRNGNPMDNVFEAGCVDCFTNIETMWKET